MDVAQGGRGGRGSEESGVEVPPLDVLTRVLDEGHQAVEEERAGEAQHISGELERAHAHELDAISANSKGEQSHNVPQKHYTTIDPTF